MYKVWVQVDDQEISLSVCALNRNAAARAARAAYPDGAVLSVMPV